MGGFKLGSNAPQPLRQSPLKPGEKVASWDSALGQAEITVKKHLGHFPSQLDAHKAIAASGDAGVVTLEQGGIKAYTVDDGAYFDDLDIGDQPVASKGLSVLNFVSDAGEELRSGAEIRPPTGLDNGKVVHVMMSYDNLFDKAVLRTPKALSTADDVSRLCELGYSVSIDRSATVTDYLSALYDPRTAGVMWFGHAGGGQVPDHQGNWFSAGVIQPEAVSPNLKLMVFESCQVGKAQDAWNKALPGAHVQAWDQNVANYETTWFNSRNSEGGLANLIETRLGGDFGREIYTPRPNVGIGGMLGGALFGGGLGAAAQASKAVAPQPASAKPAPPVRPQ